MSATIDLSGDLRHAISQKLAAVLQTALEATGYSITLTDAQRCLQDPDHVVQMSVPDAAAQAAAGVKVRIRVRVRT
jgi:hypothetical protein